jgi:hypothetical protein
MSKNLLTLGERQRLSGTSAEQTTKDNRGDLHGHTRLSALCKATDGEYETPLSAKSRAQNTEEGRGGHDGHSDMPVSRQRKRRLGVGGAGTVVLEGSSKR